MAGYTNATKNLIHTFAGAMVRLRLKGNLVLVKFRIVKSTVDVIIILV